MQTAVAEVSDIQQHRASELALDVQAPLLHVGLMPIYVDAVERLRGEVQVGYRACGIVQTGV